MLRTKVLVERLLRLELELMLVTLARITYPGALGSMALGFVLPPQANAAVGLDS